MADTPVITCPECKKKFKGKADLAGKKIKCPFCTKPFMVLADRPADAPTPGGSAAAPPQTRKVFDDEEEAGPYGVTALDLTPRCPNCANPMKDEKAFICVYCGYNSLTRQIGRTEKVIEHTTGEILLHQMPGYICVLVITLLVFGMMFYSLVLPSVVSPGAAGFFGHESIKMWLTIIVVGIIWGCGQFAYKRLIIEPLPPEKKIE